MEEGAAARLHPQQYRAVVVQNHRLIALVSGKGNDAHMVQQAVKAVCLEHVAGQVRVDVLGVVAGLQDQRLAVHVADAGEAVDRRALPQLHLFADHTAGGLHGEVHQGGGGHFAQRGDLGGEGIADAAAVGSGVGHERAAAALADYQALVLQLADGLADGVTADVQTPAQLGLAGQQRAHGQHAGGDVPFDNAHKLGIKGNVAVQRESAVENGVLFHGGCPFPAYPWVSCTYCTIQFKGMVEVI